MKVFLIIALALSATGAFAADVGSIEFIASTNGAAPNFNPQFEVNDTGSALVGAGGAMINLTKQASGLQGFALGRFLDVTCTATQCTDNGPSQLNITLTAMNGGYTLKGTANYVLIDATVTASEISLSAVGGKADMGFDLTAGSCPGVYSGNGTDGYGTFTATLSTSGTLAGLTDPATFIALMVNPFVGQ